VSRIKNIVFKIEVGALLIMGVGATLIMFINALLRYTVNYSLEWGEESIRILFVTSMFIAITTSFVRDEHIGFDELLKVTRFGRFIRDVGYSLALIIVGAITGYYGFVYNSMVGGTPLPGTDLPTGMFLVPGVIAGAVWVIIGTVRLACCRIGPPPLESSTPNAAAG
jgi:TRAP-type C4-dicarboxylate transport system permease small subunit